MAYEGKLYIKTDNQEIELTGDAIKLSNSDFATLGLATNIAIIDWDGSSGTITYNDGTAQASLANIDDYDSIATKMAENDLEGECLREP